MLDAIKRSGMLEDFEAFGKHLHPLTANDLISSFSSAEELTADELQDLYISYLFSISPELAYIASYMTQSEVTE